MAVPSARLCLVSGFAFLALAGCSSGTPEQSVQSNAPGKILSGEAFLTGLGLEGPVGSKARPDNRPRAELVIPPDRNLPQPESGEQLNAANWPRDPDQERARRLASLRQNERTRVTADRPEQGDNLSATELRSGPDIPQSRRRGRRPFSDYDYRDQAETAKTAAQLRREAALAKAIRSRQATANSPSRSLMEPPRDYQVAPEGAPPPPEKKKRRWWPFGGR